jgi:single stranded DNA-binding protein
MCQQGSLIQWTYGSCFRQTRCRILFLELCSGFLALNSHLSFTGTIGKDAEVRYLPSGQAVLNVNVANNIGFGDKQKTIWVRVSLWGKRAEGELKNYLRKGQQVFVSGELTMSEYRANDGSHRSQLELNAHILDLVGKREESSPITYDRPTPIATTSQYERPQQVVAPPSRPTPPMPPYNENEEYFRSQRRYDAWLDELIAWADKNYIPGYAEGYYDGDCKFPRDKKEILSLTELILAGGCWKPPLDWGDPGVDADWHMHIEMIPESIGNLTNLKVLHLYDNELTKLPESIGNLTNLTTLCLECNLLTKLPESIGNLINLTELNLSKNQLTALPESIGNLINLTTLRLGGNGGYYNGVKMQNQLTELPESIGNLTNLTWLDLRNNQLTELPESIGNLTNLKKLYLNENQLTELPESIGNLTNLKVLDLNNNQLTKLPESIGNLTNLTELYLNNNQLTELPESIGNLTNLTELHLYDNELTKLPESIGNLTNLTKLRLDREKLTKLPESIWKSINWTITDFSITPFRTSRIIDWDS